MTSIKTKSFSRNTSLYIIRLLSSYFSPDKSKSDSETEKEGKKEKNQIRESHQSKELREVS